MQAVRVLLVDDDPGDGLILRRFLERAPGAYEASWAKSFAEGRAALGAGGFDACLVDYRLGARTGVDFIADCRAAGDATPMLMLSGMDDPALEAQARAAGAGGFIDKLALSPTYLDRALRTLLGRS